MPPILKWLGTPSRPLFQQCTVFSETHKTSSVFAIYVMAAFIAVIGSLLVPHTAGHKLEEHWKDTLHRKRFPTTSSYEQRTSRGLHSSSLRTFPKENDWISSSRPTPLRNTDKKSTRASWLHPQNETLYNYRQRVNSAAGDERFKTTGVVNSARSLTSDHRNRKWRTANTGHFRLRIENTSTALPLRSTLRQISDLMRINAGLGADLSVQRKKQGGKHHGRARSSQPTTRNLFRNQHTESRDALTRRRFDQQIANKELPATKRNSIERKATRASFWQSRDTPKTTSSIVKPTPIGTSTPVTNRNENQLEDDGEVTDNVPKSVLFRQQTINPEEEKRHKIPHTFQQRSNTRLNRVKPENNFRFHTADIRSNIPPLKQITSKTLPIKNVGTNKPTIDEMSMFTQNTRTSRNISSEISTRSVEIINTSQDAIISTLKHSGSPFPGKLLTRSYSSPSNRMTNAPTQTMLNLSTKLGLSSFSRDASKPIFSTANQRRSFSTPLSVNRRSSTTGDNISSFDEGSLREKDISTSGISLPATMTVSTTHTERRGSRKKKGKGKKKRRKISRTADKKPSHNRQRLSGDRKARPMNTAEHKAKDVEHLFGEQIVRRLNTSSKSSDDSNNEPSTHINTPRMESKRLKASQRYHDQQQLDRKPVSVEVGSDGSGNVDYPVVREGSGEERATWLEEPQSETRIPGSDRNKHISDATRSLFKTGLPLDGHSDPNLPSKTNQSPSVLRFSTQRRKGNHIRNRKKKRKLFKKTKLPNVQSSKPSKRHPIIKDFSSLHFLEIVSGLKTTVKRSVRPVETITPIPNKNKNGTDSKRWKFQLRKQKNKRNDSYISNGETILRHRTQSPFDSNPVRKALIHSKGHSLFDHDEEPASENMKAAKMVTSSPSMQNYSDRHQNAQDGSYERKDTPQATTSLYDRLASVTSTLFSFANGKTISNEKKIGLLPTESTYSVVNGTTQAPTHFSSRIIRGTDGSKSSQSLLSTASLKGDYGAVTDKPVLYTKPKPDPSVTTKDLNIQLRSTSDIISPAHTQTTQSSTLQPLIEVTPVQSTQRMSIFHTPSQRSAATSKPTSYVTVSSTRQKQTPANSSSVKNVFPMGRLPSLSTSTPTKESLDLFISHKEHTNNVVSNTDFIKEQTTNTNPRKESEVTFGQNPARFGSTSTIFPAIWTLSTPISTYKQSRKHSSTNTRLPFTESATAKSVASTYSNLETSRLVITSTKPSYTDDKILPTRTISHNVPNHSLHSTTSSPSSVFTSSTSKAPFSLSSTTKSAKTQSTSELPVHKSSFLSSESFSDDNHKMATTSSFFHRTPDTLISTSRVSAVSKGKQDHEHQSTRNPLSERPHSTKTVLPTTRISTSSTTKTTTMAGIIVSTSKPSKGMNTTRKPLNSNRTSATTLDVRTVPRREETTSQGMSATTLSKNILTNTDDSVPTLDSTHADSSLRPKDDQPKPQLPSGSSDYNELLVKCKVKPNIDIEGNDFMEEIKNGLAYSYVEGRTLLNLRKAGSTNNKRRKREAIGYVLEQNIDAHAVHFVEAEGIEAKILRVSRREQLVEIYFQMLEYGLVIDTDTAIKVFSQLQITEISVNLHYPIYHQIEAIKHVMFQSQHPLKPSATKWMMVTIAAPSIPVLCVICILLTSWYRNHARLRRKAMAEISRGSQYAESLADVGLEIDMEKGEIVSRAGSTSVLWTEFAAGDTLERVGMAGDFPNTDSESSRSNSWNARGNSRAGANPSGQGRRQSPVAKQCQKNGKYVKKKDSVSSFHFDHNLEDECPPVYESFVPDLSDIGQWPKTSTLQSRSTSGRQQQRKDNSSTSQIYGDSVLITSHKLRPTLHANIISHFLAELDTL